MIVNNEPYLIEYNVRMGDPECQTILPKLKTDLIDIFLACCEKKLKKLNIEWLNKKSLCIVFVQMVIQINIKKILKLKNLNKIKLK